MMMMRRMASAGAALAVGLRVTACAPGVTGPAAPTGVVPAAAPVAGTVEPGEPAGAGVLGAAPHSLRAGGETALAAFVPIPASFRQALEAGTRSVTGEPGPAYWQQRVDYVIEASLVPGAARVDGSARITYRNQSPDTLDRVVFHLYQNLFAPGNPRNRVVPITGGMVIDRLVVQGRVRAMRAAADRPLSTTVAVELEQPLPPGAAAELEVDWHFLVPPAGAPRMGHENREIFAVAQWYPQVAVYDDVSGWHLDPYLGAGEFYSEYGDFEVTLRVPAGWVVAATGTLLNPAEVLTDAALARLAAALAADTVVRVLTERDVADGTLTRAAAAGPLTWRFRAQGVRDFAWAASRGFVWDATRALGPDADGDGRPEVTAIHVLYRPGKRNWQLAAGFARHAVETYGASRHPYPYPHMTVTEGVISGGMEYPMLTFIGGERSPFSLHGVVAHEIGHMWFPMMVGSNETAYAWMDEGITTFIENLAAARLFPQEQPQAAETQRYLAIAGSERETEIMRHADLYGPFGNRNVASYSKPAAVLTALRHSLGRDVFDRALREYIRRWLNRHPMPLDLFHTIEDVAGRDLDWFWYPWFYTTRVLDQAISAVRQQPGAGGYRATVAVADAGEIPMPIDLALTLEGGEILRVRVDAEAWGGKPVYTFESEVAARVVRVELDPDGHFPDVNRENNVWVAERR